MDLNGRFRCSGKAVVRCSFLNAVVCWTLAESLGAFSALREAPRWRLITTEFDGAPFASFFATWLNHFCVFPSVFCLQRRPQPLCRALGFRYLSVRGEVLPCGRKSCEN
jgi:hypothetical protein